MRGRAVLDAALNPTGEARAFVIALNLASTTPAWLESIGGKPMAKGLDLSGGIHFVLEVDVDSALAKQLGDDATNVRTRLREERIRYVRTGDMVVGNAIRVAFADAGQRDRALAVLEEEFPQPNHRIDAAEVMGRPGLAIEVDAARIDEIEDDAIDKNMVSLRNRVDEIGVSEPLVQRLGSNRIVVDLPGMQDASAAKRILDKFANLEFRLLALPDDRPSEIEEMVYEGRVRRLQRTIIVTGDRVTNAQQGYDPQTSLPQVNITLDSIGGERMHDFTAPNVGHSMAIIFIEQKQVKQADGSVLLRDDRRLISVATIQAALGYSFRITGLSAREAQELALLLRAGALAAPMRIVEERTVGASLGEENIERGMYAVGAGFLLVLIFMPIYYKVFGLIADAALTLNLIILVAVMSILGATLTLPGIAGDRAHRRHGRGRQRADLLPDPGRAVALAAAARHPGGVRPRLPDDSRRQRDDAVRGADPAVDRQRAGGRLRRDARHRHRDVDVHGDHGIAGGRQPHLRRAPGRGPGDLRREQGT